MKKKLNLILLAAGNSSRFGENKLLYKVDGKLMYEHAVEIALQCKEKLTSLSVSILLVTQYEEIRKQIQNNQQIQVVMNTESCLGVSHSITLGVKEKPADDYLFMVCDQPNLMAETVIGLIEGYEHSDKTMACLAWEDTLGNPAIFSKEYVPELLSLCGDEGGKKLIRERKNQVYIHQTFCKEELDDMDWKN